MALDQRHRFLVSKVRGVGSKQCSLVCACGLCSLTCCVPSVHLPPLQLVEAYGLPENQVEKQIS
jgi:hypothetical protein